eukprot:Skav232534  [mRNA]  locus=scaffold319:81384:83118:+ [translate_table: standard]
MLRRRHAAAIAAAVVFLLTLRESFGTARLELPQHGPEDACTSNVTILGTFGLTNDMPCTALFELTFGSLMNNVPEFRPCPKIFVFEATRRPPKRTEMDHKRYEDFMENLHMLGISNLQVFTLPNQSTLLESVRYGLSHVKTPLIFLWQPDLMLLRRPPDWPKIVQKLLEDDLHPTPEALRDVHFRYHNDWDTYFNQGPRKRHNYSGFEEDLYIVHYCDQIQLATTSFYRDHVFRLIDLKHQSIPKEDWGWGGKYMEANGDVISKEHKRQQRKSKRAYYAYWEHWFYVYPADLLSDIFHAYEKARPCRQIHMQLCLPWAPAWFAPKALGCSLLERLALYGRMDVLLYTLMYGGAGFVPAWAALRGRNMRLTTHVLLLLVASCLPWALVNFGWGYGQLIENLRKP